MRIQALGLLAALLIVGLGGCDQRGIVVEESRLPTTDIEQLEERVRERADAQG